jgi:hypothetical protein
MYKKNFLQQHKPNRRFCGKKSGGEFWMTKNLKTLFYLTLYPKKYEMISFKIQVIIVNYHCKQITGNFILPKMK